MNFVGTPQLLNATHDTPRSRLLRGIRDSRVFGWLAHRGSFVIGMPVLSALGLATSLYIPRLVTPAEFGAYALLLNVFRYAGRCDLGLTQLADRKLAVPHPPPGEARAILELRMRLGLLTLCAAIPIVAAIAYLLGISQIDAILAVTAGLCSMIAAGPSTVFRAQGRIWEYTALAFLFGIGFIVPRLVGFTVGGVTGCFALWLLWYGAMAIACIWWIRGGSGLKFAILPAVKSSLPLFVFAGSWTVYLTVDRWVAAVLSSPSDLGLFALGANLATAAIITFGQISDVRYPRWLKLIQSGRPFQHSRSIELEALVIGAATALAVAVAIPFADDAIRLCFPAYVGAAGPMIGVAAACVPTIVVAWFLPVAIARSRKPLIDTILLFLPSAILTAAGMVLGNRLAGISGQAWACCVSAYVLLVGLTIVLRRSGVLDTRSACRTAGASALMLVLLAGMTFTLRSSEARDTSRTLMPPSDWHHVFAERFTSLSLWDGHAGTWQTSYLRGERTNKTNSELEFYASPRDRTLAASLAPYSINKDGLQITAQPVPAAQRSETGGLPFVSGLLNSAHSFSFTYGYAVMRARLPQGRGLWPAFWLLPTSGRDPPELDVMEMIGHEPTRYYATLHSSISGVSMNTIAVAPVQQDFHDYGVLWTRETITWLFDGRIVAKVPTPTDMHGPMYLLVNLAVGGKWPGSPDSSTVFPADMQIQSINVYQEPVPGNLDASTAREGAK